MPGPKLHKMGQSEKKLTGNTLQIQIHQLHMYLENTAKNDLKIARNSRP